MNGNHLHSYTRCSTGKSAALPGHTSGTQVGHTAGDMKDEEPVGDDLVAQLRENLSPEECDACDDDMARRFLRADRLNLAAATKRLKETLAWRKETKPEQLICTHCAKQPTSHYFHPVGFSSTGMPVLYSAFALANDRSADGNRNHMIMTFEQAVRLMQPGVEKWVWFSDFVGFGWKDCNVTLGKIFLDLASKHYPERLGCFVLCGTPAIFKTLWHAILPFVDPVTKEKIKLIPYDVDKEAKLAGSSELHAFLTKEFPAETSEWILEEMAENRRREVLQSKRYCQTEIHQAVTSGSSLKKHWGSSQLLKLMEKDPSYLMPQAQGLPAPMA